MDNVVQITNSSGKIFYGMHFYPGVAQYEEAGKEPLRVYLNEDTLRKMDPTFAGKPIFVDHVEGVDDDVDVLRKEADGWVIESFFNQADGKHWVKFILTSNRALRAVERGHRLSNAYLPQLENTGGTWNGVPYQQQVTSGEFEHLAIVEHPRYEESVIMTPEEFKQYNENLHVELKRIANSKQEKESKLMFFKKTKVENSKEYEQMSVTLPKSKKEMTLIQVVNAADELELKKKENVADMKGMVKLHDGSMCNVEELVSKHKSLNEELEAMKSKDNEDDGEESDMIEDSAEEEQDLMPEDEAVDVEGDLHNEDEAEDDEKKKNEDDEDENSLAAAKKKKENEEAKPSKDAPAPKKANAKVAPKKILSNKEKIAAKRKEHFESLKNAHLNARGEERRLDLDIDRVARGKNRYGSN